jgi:DNA-binding transcriptional LysR family regulator
MPDIDESKIRQLDGSLLLVLRELLRQRRATLVARRLGLSQSAISHALRRLRELFDDPLFVRKPYGLEPTRHARELAPRIDALLDAMHDALGLPGQFSAEDTPRSFRIGAPDHVATSLAPALVEAFQARAPKARFVFSQRLGPDAQQAVLRDELDVALGRFGTRDERLTMLPLYDDKYCLVARADHPKLRRKLTPALYQRLDQVQVSVSADFRAPEFATTDHTWRPGRIVAAVPRFLIAFAAVGRSEAITIAPERLARRYAKAFGIRVHALPFDLAPLEVLIARRRHPDAGVDFLIEQLKRAAANT